MKTEPNMRSYIAADVRFGSKADICSAKRYVRFTPESRHVHCNSVYPLCANNGHCAASIEQRVGALQKLFWNCEPYGLRSLEIDDQLELRRLLNR